MTELKPQWIVDTLNKITIDTITKRAELVKKQEEMKGTTIYNEISNLEYELKELSKQDKEIKEQWKQILLDSWIKKFEALDWTIIQLNKKPWKLIITEELLIPTEYRIEKTTKSLNKKDIKDNIKQWEIIDWVEIQEDYNLIIKHK